MADGIAPVSIFPEDLQMLRDCCVWLLLLLGCVCLAACSNEAKPPAPLNADQEREMQKQLDDARNAEGEAQQQETPQESR